MIQEQSGLVPENVILVNIAGVSGHKGFSIALVNGAKLLCKSLKMVPHEQKWYNADSKFFHSPCNTL